MKTHTIKTPTAELMIVELEKGARKTAAFIVDVNGDPILDNYTLLGKADEIREEEARELVEERTDIEGNCYYEDHGIVNGTTPTATESLLSAIESVVFWENPFGESKYFHGEYTDNGRIAAELRTFDRNRTLIFVKN